MSLYKAYTCKLIGMYELSTHLYNPKYLTSSITLNYFLLITLISLHLEIIMC